MSLVVPGAGYTRPLPLPRLPGAARSQENAEGTPYNPFEEAEPLPQPSAAVQQDHQDEWRWDGNKIVPLDDTYRDSQHQARLKILREQQEAVARPSDAQRRIRAREAEQNAGKRLAQMEAAKAVAPAPSPVAGPDKNAMYWQLVLEGMPPQEAVTIINNMFHWSGRLA